MSKKRDFDEREQREWDAQESALRAERSGQRTDRDPTVAQYRLIARALRTPPLDALPSDFALRTAIRAEREVRVADERIEQWIGRGLAVVLLLVGALVLYGYGREVSFPALSVALPERTSLGVQTIASWSFVVAACIGLSSAFAFARKH